MNRNEVVYTYTKSPFGDILLAREEAGLTHISFQTGVRPLHPEPEWRKAEGPLADAAEQLRAYFYGEMREFDLPLAPRGTSFQRAVWDVLLKIPYGESCSYADVARAIGRPNAQRAVGSANNANPVSLVVPCHRVIAADGSLGGYGGGQDLKARLLAMERSWPSDDRLL